MSKRALLPQLKEQVTEAVKILIHKERKFQKTRKEKIVNLNQLQPGDHVSFYKTDLYYAHHGIVYKVQDNVLTLIHYFNTLEHARSALMKGSIYIAAIIESDWTVNVKSKTEDLFLHHYDDIECYSNEETLQRALSELGRRGYSLLGNNCEHWCRWCRTGEHYSEQIYKFRNLVQEKSATLLIVDPTALLIKDVALVGAQGFIPFLSAVGSGLVLTVVEGLSTYVDIKHQKKERKKGNLSDVALKKYIVRRITSGSALVIGGTVGTVVGSILIPVPILGSTIGGVVGSVGGKLIGGVSGIALSKVVEVYQRIKEAKIRKMTTLPQLMNNISPESELVRGLISITMNNDEVERISNAIEETINRPSSSLYPSLEEFISKNESLSKERCQAVSQLTTELFNDTNGTDIFVLTPVNDENAAEEFASSADLLVLRWPSGIMAPWEQNEEYVLNIDDSSVNRD